jgi:hypothetical protein
MTELLFAVSGMSEEARLQRLQEQLPGLAQDVDGR